jgi:hypothetical protein
MNRSAYSPVNPKFLFYRTAGTGRDTYISHDNGGILRSKTKVSAPIRGRSRAKEAARTRQSPKSLHYHCNGTGRDVYIGNDDGGLHSPTAKGLNSSFIRTLRNYSPVGQSSPLNKTDYFSWAQTTWNSSSNRKVLDEKTRVVRSLMTRLTNRRHSAGNHYR